MLVTTGMQPPPPGPPRRSALAETSAVEMTSGTNPMHATTTPTRTPAQNKWRTARNKMLSATTLANLDAAATATTPEQKTADKLLAQQRLATTRSGQSGALRGQAAAKIRQNFLTFTLLLSVIIVTTLAGFGTVASTEQQLLTVRLLGQSLLRSIRGDLASLLYYTEREIAQLAINFPLSNDTEHVVNMGVQLMFAQLDSSSGIDELVQNDSPIWQLYFANEQGLVVGVGRASVSASDVTNTSSYFECWSGKSGNTVRRTAPAQKCGSASGWFDEQDQVKTGAATTNIQYSEYEYDARQRPWYTLAKQDPGQIVWTKPYRFASTGYMGVTATLSTKVGVRWKDNTDGNSKVVVEQGVFGIDITLNDLEKFLRSLAKSAQSLGTFGSFPAEIALLQNMPTPKDVIVTSTASARVIINGQLNIKGGKHDHLIDTAIKNEQVANNVIIRSFRSMPDNLGWFLFASRVRFGGKISGWDAVVVGILRQSNFLGMLELTSRAVYPFIAATLVIIIIPTTGLTTRCILKNDKGTHLPNNRLLDKSVCLASCWGQTMNTMRLRAHTIVPIIVAVVVSAVVHTLATCWSEEEEKQKIGWGIILPAFSIFSKVGLSYVFHRSWMLTIVHHVGGKYEPSTTSKALALIFAAWIVVSIVVVATVNAVPSMRILQGCTEVLLFLSLNVLVKGDQYGENEADIVAERKPWLLWLMFGSVVVTGLVFTVIDAAATWTLTFSVYLIPSLVSIVLLSLGAKFDSPIRRAWPRPQVVIYMMTSALIFMWLVPWLTITATQVVKDSVGDTRALQPLAMANATTNELTALSMSPEDIGLLINFGWSFFCIILAIFFEFFVEASATSSMQMGLHFGFILFKSFVETVLFLVVKPLDLGFYALVLMQCLVKIVLGLGLKNYICDKYCSRGLWKKDPETFALKMMTRAVKVNFGIVAPMCTKFGMIAMVLLEALQVNVRGDESKWQPPFTHGLHQLERMSMAAGFFVQVAFHLVSNEIIESTLSLKISKFKRKMATIRMFARNTVLVEVEDPNNDMKGKRVITKKMKQRKSSIDVGGLGAHEIGQTSGTEWKWEKHIAVIFERNWTVFVVWTAYLMCELIGISLAQGRKE